MQALIDQQSLELINKTSIRLIKIINKINFFHVVYNRLVIYTVGQKLHPFCFLNNFVKSRSILIIFGTQIPEWICNRIVTKLFTFPNECHYTTLWNRTCVKVLITTVMQALNVMTNWQLRTNTSQQMFKMFSFGFKTRIKTISSLINCLISDALLDSRPC